ncbi:MAG: TetR/AcrR family transcriptional regulator [Rhizomicrobium sp.]
MAIKNLASKNKRIRRTPEEARRLILEAAEAGMAAGGPAGLRLEMVAKAAGVSHPTILHHFGSREGLIQALNLRAIEQLRTVLIDVLGSSPKGSENAITPIFAAYRNGLAQRMVWLMQSGSLVMGPAGLPMLDEMVLALHGLRERLAGPGAQVDIADTKAIVHLTTFAAFGDAILGKRLRRAPTPAEEIAQRQAFENWFSEFLNVYMARKV